MMIFLLLFPIFLNLSYSLIKIFINKETLIYFLDLTLLVAYPSQYIPFKLLFFNLFLKNFLVVNNLIIIFIPLIITTLIKQHFDRFIHLFFIIIVFIH